jgi:alpha-L-rhamnosidase
LAFCENRARESTRPQNESNPWKEYLADQGFHFGEWCEPDVNNMLAMRKNAMEGAPEVATAYYYRSASLLARIAEILGKTEDAGRFAQIAENAKKAYRFTCTRDGRIESGRQCAYVRPIAFGLLDGEENRQAADALNELVLRNGCHLNTGFLSTPYLLSVLADNGRADIAYRLLLQDECPGWLYAVKKGATSIWECWDGVRPDGTVHDSLNHYSYGAVTGWLFSGACGISLKGRELSITPHPGRELGYAKASWDSPVGRIESSWVYEEDRIVFHFHVPVPAVITLPNDERHEVTEGDCSYEVLL